MQISQSFYSLLRTFFHTCSAMCTLLLVYMSYIVLNSYSSCRTVLFTDVTCDTSDTAVLVNQFAHVLRFAGYSAGSIIWNKINEVARTNIDTLATGLTLILIDYCYTVYHMDGIKLTYRYAASAAKASVGTSLGSATRKLSLKSAISFSVVLVLALCLFTVTLTVNICNHPGGISGLNAHDS